MEKIRISVSAGDIAEYCFPEGSLGSIPSVERMQKGTAVHKKLQNAYQANEDISYRREVPLKYSFETENAVISVHGRADGIFWDKKDWYIHEIKSTYCASASIESPLKSAHKAQMMVYACIFAKEKHLESIKCRLTYYCISEDSTVNFDYTFSLDCLWDFTEKMAKRYSQLIYLRRKRHEELVKSSADLQFPFEEFRKGQRNGASQVYLAIKNRRYLFLQAPTGSGKTVTALFPAVKLLAEDEFKIFCLNAKNQTRSVNEQCLNSMREKGLKIRSCTISARSKCCLTDGQNCSPDVCPYSLDFYKKLPDCLEEMLTLYSFTPEVIAEYAKKYEVCPHELSIALSNECDVVICDYNYLFDPTVYLKNFFDTDGNYLFLIDEAHNLPDRGRDMYSVAIDPLELRQVKKKLQKSDTLYKRFSRILTETNKLIKTSNPNTDSLDGLKSAISLLSDALQTETLDVPSEIILYANELLRFNTITEYYNENDFRIFSDGKLNLQCTDASKMLENSLKKGFSAILYSATLSPYFFYKNCIMPEIETFSYKCKYPFSPKNLTVFADCSVDTRYSYRDDSYKKIAENIALCREKAKGRLFCFFPSYEFMNRVGELCDFALIQPYASDQEARNAFLSEFLKSENSVAFCVMGSHFSEGADIKGIKGIIVTGLGLPKYGTFCENIRTHFDKKYGNGFDYAYLYPGINKISQSAGRLIRTKDDSGFIFLMDSRISRYFHLLPDYWDIKTVETDEDITRILLSETQ